MVVKKRVITRTNKQGKPQPDGGAPKSDFKYSTFYTEMKKGQEHFNLYSISDVYINARTQSKVELKKLEEYVSEIKKDPNALVVLNGNLFWFDDAIFGFDKGVPVPAAFKVHYDNASRVKEELTEIKLLEKNGTKQNLTREEMSSLIEDRFTELSEDARIKYVIERLRIDENFAKTEFYQTHKTSIFYLLQKKAYEPFERDFVRMFEPIKDKIVIINPGNEEEKINNFRQYNPMYNMALKLKKEDVYSDTRFWLLNVLQNSHLTDNNDQIITLFGAYGILNANSLSAMQSKANNIFKGTVGVDAFVLSGYEANAWYKSEGFFKDAHGNIIMKPQSTVMFAGFRKVPETNNVRLKSYVIEREINKNCAVFSAVRNPAYLSQKWVDSSGKLIKFNEEYFLGLQALTFDKVEDQEFIEKFAIKPPYRVYMSMESTKARSQYIEDLRTKYSNSKKLTGLALYELIEAQIIKAKAEFDKRVLEETQQQVPSNKEKANEYVKTFNKTIR